MPSYFFSTRSSSAAERANAESRKWLKTRKLSEFASFIANALTGVHGSGTPTSELKIGPKRLDHSVRLCGFSEPSDWHTCTATVRLVICSGWPSYRYVVGEPGTSVSWYGVKRNAVETVWLQAMLRVLPISTTGTPNTEAPSTFS